MNSREGASAAGCAPLRHAADTLLSGSALDHSSAPPDMLWAALFYATRLSWAVFPATPRGKGPVGYLVPRGVLDATIDATRIRDWWSRCPRANVGIGMGASGLATIDVDRHGTDGEDSLRELERQHGALPETIVGLTGGGGRHFVFRAPAGVKLRQIPLAPGVDVRVGNGYIIAPPGIHPNGSQYAWDAAHHPLDLDPGPLPDWIVDRLRATDRSHGPAEGRVTESLLGRAFHAAGWLLRVIDDARAAVRCPWERLHTVGSRGDSSTVIFAATSLGGGGAFYCSHEHCRRRTHTEVLAALPREALCLARRDLARWRFRRTAPLAQLERWLLACLGEVTP